jgi:hypothetical protein
VADVDPPYPDRARAVIDFEIAYVDRASGVVGSMELRTLFAPFRLFRMNMVFGMVFFLNVGHIWSTFVPEPPFESAGSSSAWGAGVGLLLRWGETMVVRIEAGYSPDASDGGLPVGIYFTLGHAY